MFSHTTNYSIKRVILACIALLISLCIGTAFAETAAEEPYVSADGWIYQVLPDDSAVLLGHTDPAATKLSIPAMADGHWIREIAPGSFSTHESLTQVTVSSAVEKIAEGAFGSQEALVLSGYHGAAVQAYAEKNGIGFECLSAFEFQAGVLDLSEISRSHFSYESDRVWISEPWSALLTDDIKIFLPASQQYTMGAPWKITGLTQTEDGVWVTVEAVYVEDILARILYEDEKLVPDLSEAVTMYDTLSFFVPGSGSGLSVQGRGTESSLSAEFGLKGSVPLDNGEKIEFELIMAPELTVDVDCRFPFSADKIALSYELKNSHSFVFKYSIKSFDHKEDFDHDFQKALSIARVPFVSNGLVKAILDISLNISLTGEVTVECSTTYMESGSYKNGTFTREKHTPETNTHFTASVEAAVELKPMIALNVGFTGTSFQTDLAQLYLSAKVAASVSTDSDTLIEVPITNINGEEITYINRACADLKADLSLSMGLKIGLLHKKYQVEVLDIKWVICKKPILELHYEALDGKWHDSCQQFKKVTFFDGYSPEVTVTKVKIGETVEPLPNLAREGYTFANWYTEPECNNVYDFNSAVLTDFALYAGWMDSEGKIAVGELPKTEEDQIYEYEVGSGGNGYSLYFEMGYAAGRGDGWVLSGVSGTPVDVVVPAYVNGIPVIQIGSWTSLPFYGNETLETITLPDTVEVIYDGAFEICESLRKIDMGDGVKEIGWVTFYGCSNLEEVVFSRNLERIRDSAFEGCSKLKSIELSSSMEFIGSGAFNGCSAATKLILPKRVESIGDAAFGGVSSVTEMTLPEYIGSAGNFVFQTMLGLKNITIPSTWDKIPYGMFNNCNGLTELIIPANIKIIEENAFIYSHGLKKVTICSDDVQIDRAAFSGCTKLEQVVFLGSGVTVGEEAFSDCALTEVSWNAISSYGVRSFADNATLKTAYIAHGVETLPRGVFNDCTALETVVLPETITTIEEDALGRTNLRTLTIPGGVKTLPEYAVYNAENLEELWLSDGVEVIENQNFRYSSNIQLAYFPPSVNQINITHTTWKVETLLCEKGSYAEEWFRTHMPDTNIAYTGAGQLYLVNFASNGGTAVDSVLSQYGRPINPPVPPTRDEYTFIGWFKDKACTDQWNFAADLMPDSSMTLYAGWALSEAYFQTEYDAQGQLLLSGYLGTQPQVKLPKTIGGKAVVGLAADAIGGQVRHLELPSSYTAVNAAAFRRASQLQSISVEAENDSFMAVDGVLFTTAGQLICYPQSRNNLRYTLPDICVSVGSGSFQHTLYLQELVVPSNVREIMENAFYLSQQLESVTFESDEITLAENLFDSVGMLQDDTSQGVDGMLGLVKLYGPVDSEYLRSYAERESLDYNVYTVVCYLDGQIVALFSCMAGQQVEMPPSLSQQAQMISGWSTALEYGELWDFETNVMPQEDLYLYGVWSDEYTFDILDDDHAVLLKYLGAETEITVPEMIAEVPVTSIAEDCFPIGVVLLGNRGSVTEQFAQEHGFTFKELKYRLHFESNGGALIADQNLAATERFDAPECVRDNYIFTGWYVDPDCTVLWDFDTGMMPAGDLTLYAGWTIIDESITDHAYTVTLEQDGLWITGYTGKEMDITLPVMLNGQQVVGIADFALSNHSGIRSVTIPGEIRSIGRYAFAGASLQQVVLEEGVSHLGESSFADCGMLMSVMLPDSLETISRDAFAGCGWLSQVRWPAGLRSIESGAFADCALLQTAALPDALESIDAYAFSNCAALQEVVLGADLQRISETAFRGCSKLASLSISEENEHYMIKDGMLLSKDGSMLVLCPSGYPAQTLTIPDTVSVIAGGALNACCFETLVLPSSVVTLGEGFAEGCYKLSRIEFAADCQLTEISNNAFRSCKSLTAVEIPQSVVSIGSGAFAYCQSLERLEIPNTVESIHASALRGSEQTVIYGASGSAAERFAIANGFRFISEAGVPVMGIVLPESMTLMVGEEMLLQAELLPPDTTETTIRWYSEDESIAQVNDGVVMARRAGIVQIYAVAQNGVKAACEITVQSVVVQPEQIVLDVDTLQLEMGESYLLTVQVVPETAAAQSFQWSSSDEQVAVALQGLVVAKRGGTATITVQAPNGVQASVEVSVHQPVEIVSIERSSYALSKGDIVTLTAEKQGSGEQIEYQFTVLLNDQVYLRTPWQPEPMLALPLDQVGEYTVQVQARDVLRDEYSNVAKDTLIVHFLQSDHPYADMEDRIWTYTEENAEYLAITFSEDTYLEAGWDHLIITDASGKERSYSGSELQNARIGILGDTVTLRLTSDGSNTDFGFVVTDIAVIDEAEYRELTYEPIVLVDMQLSSDVLCLGETLQVNPICLCSGKAAYQYTVSRGGEIVAQSEWIAEQFAYYCRELGEYTVSVQAWDRTKDVYTEVLEKAFAVQHIQSQHPYGSYTYQAWTYTLEGAEYLLVTFSEETEFENNYDYLYVADAAGNESSYTGTELQGASVPLVGDTVSLLLETDGSDNRYGFTVTEIRALTQAEYKDLTYRYPIITELLVNPEIAEQGKPFTVEAVPAGDAEAFAWQYTVRHGETQVLQSDWLTEPVYELQLDAAGTYTIAAQVKDMTKDVLSDVLSQEINVCFFQSAHPYANNTDQSWSWTVEGAEYLVLTFHEDSQVEYDYDHIYITDAQGKTQTLTGYFGRNQVAVKGDRLTLRLVTDKDGAYFGFAVTDIRAITEEEYYADYFKAVDIYDGGYTPRALSLHDTVTFYVLAGGGSGELAYRLTTLLDGEIYAQTPWQESDGLQVYIGQLGAYEFTAEVMDLQTGDTASTTRDAGQAYLAQTDHPYGSAERQWFLSVAGAEYMELDFGDEFLLNGPLDYLTITDSYGNTQRFTNDELQNGKVGIRGSSCTLKMHVGTTWYGDEGNYSYGFWVKDAYAITEEEYNDRYGNTVVERSLEISPAAPSLNDEITLTVSGGSGEMEYRFTVEVDGKTIVQSPWMTEAVYTLTADQIGLYSIVAQVRNVADDALQEMLTAQTQVWYMQSVHPYASNANETWTYQQAGAEYLEITFSDQTALEEGCDWIFINDASGSYRSYSGTSLAGMSVGIVGDGFTLTLQSDESYQLYGFEVVSVRTITGEEYNEKYGCELMISAVQSDKYWVQAGESVIVTAVGQGFTPETEFMFTVVRDGEVYMTSPWQKGNQWEFQSQEVGSYDIWASARSSAESDPVGHEFELPIDVVYLRGMTEVMTSLEQSWYLTLSDAEAMTLRFSEDTYLDKGDTTLVICDAEGTRQVFTGEQLAGRTIGIKGGSVTATLRQEYGRWCYGYFDVVEVNAISLEEYYANYAPALEVQEIQLSGLAPSLNDSVTASVKTTGGSGSLKYCYTVLHEGEIVLQTGWIGESYYTFSAARLGTWNVSVAIKDIVMGQEYAEVLSPALQVCFIQSEHPYACNEDRTWTYEAAETDLLELTFSSNSSFEYVFDTLTITDQDGSNTYTGTELAGQTLTVRGSFTLRLKTDDVNTAYGFAITEIKKLDDSQLFRVDDGGMLLGYNGHEVQVEIPDEVNGIRVTGIAAAALADMNWIESVLIPDGVQFIEPDAFPAGVRLVTQNNLYVLLYAEHSGYDCLYQGGLMKLPAALSIIEQESFAGVPFVCIRLPEGTTSIGGRAFADMPGLRMIYVPAAVTSIAEDAFAGSEQVYIICEEGTLVCQYAQERGMTVLLLEK